MIEMMQMETVCVPLESSCRAGAVNQWADRRRDGEPVPPGLSLGENLEAPKTGNQVQRNARRKVEKALTYMLQHLDRSVSVPALSAMAGLSTSNFYLLFKLGTGFTPNDLHIRARMSRACLLLQETDLSVKEIANRLGYDDQYYFSRLFKLVKGLPPREYRARMLKSEFSRVSNQWPRPVYSLP